MNASKPAAKSSTGDDKAPATPVKRKPAGASGGSAKKKTRGTKKEESDDDIKDPKLAPKPTKGVKKEPKKEPKDEYDSSLSGRLTCFWLCFPVPVKYLANISNVDVPDSGADSDAGTSFDST